MTLKSPYSLLLLLPWTAITLRLLWGRRKGATVPFLSLWRSAATAPRTSRLFHPPPLALLAALLAALLGIFASARPILSRGTTGPLVTIIFDRGVTMSAGNRSAEVIDGAKTELVRALGPGPTDFVAVPDGSVTHTDRSGWIALARELPPTQTDTAIGVIRAVREALARSDDAPVIVLSDQPVPRDESATTRVVQIAPTTPLRNVAIANFVLRTDPHPQAMVTVRNDSAALTADRGTLTVSSGSASASQLVNLPPAGETLNCFLDLPSTDATARAELEVVDDIKLDNVAYLAREDPAARVEIRGDVPPEVRRVLEAYQRARPSSRDDGGAVIAIVPESEPLGATESGVVVASKASASDGAPTTYPSLDVRAHPITANVDWSRVPFAVVGEPGVPPPGAPWEPLVRAGPTLLIGARESPARQVWISTPLPSFARSPDFVVLWTNVIEWLKVPSGDAPHRFGAAPAREFGPDWEPLDRNNPTPGIWRRADGKLRAASTPNFRPNPVIPFDWRAKLGTLAGRSPAGIDLLPGLCITALACLLVAACAWPGRNLTPFSPPRTV